MTKTIPTVMGGLANDTLTAAAYGIIPTDVEGGPGDDVLNGGLNRTYYLGDYLLGGSGRDTLNGSAQGEDLVGGLGDDVVFGNGGDDYLVEGGPWDCEYPDCTPNGADALSGGDGVDTVEYAERSAPVFVTIGVGVDDGAAGEGDDVESDVENVFGGFGNDTLTGSGGDNLIVGFGGDDQIFGLGGNDDLEGEADSYFDLFTSKDDTVHGGDGNDTIFGNLGADHLFGDNGNDHITGGSGADDMHGGANDDAFDAKDEIADTVDGGTGNDVGTFDSIDVVTNVP